MCLKIAIFYTLKKTFFGPKGPYIAPGSPKPNFFNPLSSWGKIRSKPYVTWHAYSIDPRILDVGQNALMRAFVRRIFAFISRFSIPANVDIYIFEYNDMRQPHVLTNMLRNSGAWVSGDVTASKMAKISKSRQNLEGYPRSFF